MWRCKHGPKRHVDMQGRQDDGGGVGYEQERSRKLAFFVSSFEQA